MNRVVKRSVGLNVTVLEDRLTPVRFDFRFDYDRFSNGDSIFFDSPERVAALEAAGKELGALLKDNLAAIAPNLSMKRLWTAQFVNPSTGADERLENLFVGEDTIIIYVGGKSTGDGERFVALASGGTVANASGDGPFQDAVYTRNQLGAWGLDGTFTDFGPWGGSISFNLETNWYFGADPNGAQPDQINFRSTVLHELGHILGYGTATSWSQKIEQSVVDSRWYFTGPHAIRANNGLTVPVEFEDAAAHWAPGVKSVKENRPAIMNGDPADHIYQNYTTLDLAGLRDIGWEIDSVSPPVPPLPPEPPQPPPPPPPEPPVPPQPPKPPLAREELTIISSDKGRVGQILVFNPNGSIRTQFTPYGNFTGGVRSAAAELTGDKFADIVTAPGPSMAPEVRIFDGRTNALIRSFLAYEESFTGGVFLASADLNQDGFDEVITSADVGGGPRIRVFDGRTNDVIADFLGIEDPRFRGGCRISVGDMNGDGVADLAVAAGVGGGPRVALYDGVSIRQGRPEKLIADFFIFEPKLQDGVFVALGDINGDGRADLTFGAGPGGGPRVYILDGQAMLASNGQNRLAIANFFAGDPESRSGIRVAVKRLNSDNRSELLISSGPGQAPTVSRYDGFELSTNPNPKPTSSETLFEAEFNGGIFIG
ncbi:MAG: hypothetical protein ACRC8S_05080 [Fimbriiglobus sp.]